MAQVSKHPLEPKVEERVAEIFLCSIKEVQSEGEVVNFLNDLLTKTEKIMLAKRVAIAYLLLRGDYTYKQIRKTLRVSQGTIAKINATLALQGEGYRKLAKKLSKKKAIKNLILDLGEIIKPFPSKGQNWKKFERQRKEKRRSANEPF